MSHPVAALTDDSSASLVRMAADAHKLMLEHDDATKGHAAIRNAALIRLCDVYELDVSEVARLTGVRDGAIRTVLYKAKKKAGRA